MGIVQYIGARYVPKFFEGSDGSEWEPNITYEPLTIVTYLGSSWTSKKNVPATVGAPNLNPQYWANTGNYNGQISAIMEELYALQEDMGSVQDSYVEAVDSLAELQPSEGKPVLFDIDNPFTRYYRAIEEYTIKDYAAGNGMYLEPVTVPDFDMKYNYIHKDIELDDLPSGYNLQGACQTLDGSRYVMCFANSDFTDVKIFTIKKDLTDPIYIGSFQYGHANDICTDGNYYYLATLRSGPYANSIIKLNNLFQRVETYAVGYATIAIAYTGDEFFVIDDTLHLHVYDSDFTELRSSVFINPFADLSATDGGLEFHRERKTLFWNASIRSAGDGTNATWPYHMIAEMDIFGNLLKYHFIPTLSPQHEPENIIYDNGYLVFIGRRGVNFSRLTYGKKMQTWASYNNPFEIMGNDDLDDYITPGEYVSHSGAVTNTLSHSPFTDTNFHLLVEYLGNGNYRQLARYVRNTGDIVGKVRSYYGDTGTWSAWEYILELTQILGHVTVELEANEQKNERISLTALGNQNANDYTFTYSISGAYAGDAVSSIVYGKATGYVDLRLKNMTGSAITVVVDWTAVCRPLL